ncbi:hypothetical protein RchiOBHm_Chr3g0470261 [Rosa chinensis]|uniref:Uncharacterized protein n=1 Tax=Rosa chinensis TaxID=74649 RepID=A0A2P6RB04_ROSCH|nr:hypothetical protein RchiOBHm_Chr3g0470261 [Rosa chinensis]
MRLDRISGRLLVIGNWWLIGGGDWRQFPLQLVWFFSQPYGESWT